MNLLNPKYRFLTYPLLLVGVIMSLPADAVAQGSIFGVLQKLDLSTPPDASVSFIGFIDNTDTELRTNLCIGAGYESGHWFDDFQNYIGETPGLEYRYYFFSPLDAQASALISEIPDNSYEQQDIILAAADFPTPAESLDASTLAGGQVELTWTAEPGWTYHVYRRASTSGGSFFRIDNPTGDLADRGIAGDSFEDADVVTDFGYQYILVTESTPGNYSPASDIVEISLTGCCLGMVGDVNGIGGDTPTIGDVSLLIDHLFITGTMPACIAEADINQSGGPNPTTDDLSIGDISILIDHLFITQVAIPECL